jgi:hypothetical protein
LFPFPQKKKAKRSTRRADGDDEPLAGPSANGNGDVDMDAATAPQRQRLDREAEDNLVDDEDLQMQQAKERRKNAMKMSRRRPEDIAAEGKLSLAVVALRNTTLTYAHLVQSPHLGQHNRQTRPQLNKQKPTMTARIGSLLMILLNSFAM